MTNYSILNISLTLLAAVFPFSLVIINAFTKLFSKLDPKLSNITTIATSVSGVLTNNALSVKRILIGQFEIETQEENTLVHVFNEENKNEVRMEKKQLPKIDGIKILSTITSLCHYKKLEKIENIMENFFKNCNISPYQLKADFEIIANLPSNEEKKISTVVAVQKNSQEIFSFVKGNPHHILDRCTRILINDKKIDLTPQTKRKLRKKIQKINKHGEKIIAFAYKGLPLKRLEKYTEQFAENDLVFVGMLSLCEKPNLDLIPVIEEAQKDKIKFYVISHVKEREAVAIATDLKLINPHYFETITGNDIKEFNEQKFAKIFSNREKDYVFCELKSSDKELVINALQKSGETVALAQKDTHSIQSIYSQIKTSRARNQNSEKLVFHALSLKISLIISLIICLIFKIPPAVSIAGILIVELLVNIPLQLSLRKDPNGNFEQLKPDRKTYIHLIINGLVCGVIITTVYIFSLTRFGWIPFEEGVVLSEEAIKTSLGITLITILLIQILNAYNTKNLKSSIFSKNSRPNIFLNISSIFVILIIYFVLNTPEISSKINVSAPKFADWQIAIFLSLMIVAIEEIRKYLTQKLDQNAA